jgi:protein SCO1/2
MGRDIFFISVSVDLEHDTPEMLKAFGEAFDAGPGWQFVTGKPADVDAILARSGDRSSGRGLPEHRNELLLGNDANGDWQRVSALGESDQLLLTIRIQKFSDPVRQTTYNAASDVGYVFDGGQPGEVMFKKVCAGCHTIGHGDRAGPDLRGVAERRHRA